METVGLLILMIIILGGGLFINRFVRHLIRSFDY